MDQLFKSYPRNLIIEKLISSMMNIYILLPRNWFYSVIANQIPPAEKISSFLQFGLVPQVLDLGHLCLLFS